MNIQNSAASELEEAPDVTTGEVSADVNAEPTSTSTSDVHDNADSNEEMDREINNFYGDSDSEDEDANPNADGEVLEEIETQEELLQRKLVEIVHSVRRMEPVSARRKKALTFLDGVRDKLIKHSRKALTDEEADDVIVDFINELTDEYEDEELMEIELDLDEFDD
jgi:hypothetical protein